MPWAALLLVLVGCYTTFKLYRLNKERGRLKYLGLVIAVALFTLTQLAVTFEAVTSVSSYASVSDFIIEWGHLASLAFVLSSLAVFIRESKPVFAQFPLLYTALPLLIIVSYVLVKDTYALKTWLISIYQGGAILVSLLMYSVYTYHRKEYRLILFGIIVFVMSYISFWYVPGVRESYPWIWRLFLAIGIITTITGYEQADLEPAKQGTQI